MPPKAQVFWFRHLQYRHAPLVGSRRGKCFLIINQKIPNLGAFSTSGDDSLEVLSAPQGVTAKKLGRFGACVGLLSY